MSQLQGCRARQGFSLVELMLALSLGLALSGVMLQGLMAEGQNGLRFSRLMRARAVQRRTLDLIQRDLAQATMASVDPSAESAACGLSGRRAVLHLKTAAGLITYSMGAPPSRIWRGAVLLRCGPAYGLDGWLQAGTAPVQRVVLDALVAGETGVVINCDSSSGVATISLHQAFSNPTGRTQQISTSRIVPGTIFQ